MCHIKCSHINFRKSHEVQSQRGNLTVAANQIREPADEMTFLMTFSLYIDRTLSKYYNTNIFSCTYMFLTTSQVTSQTLLLL